MAEVDRDGAVGEGEWGSGGGDAVLSAAGELREVVFVETAGFGGDELEVGSAEGEEGGKGENCGLHFEGVERMRIWFGKFWNWNWSFNSKSIELRFVRSQKPRLWFVIQEVTWVVRW